MCKGKRTEGMNRRAFVAASAAGALLPGAVLAQTPGAPSPGAPSPGAPSPSEPPPRPAARDLSPADVLNLLNEGNRRFVAGNIMAPNRNVARMREVAAGQTPIAAFLGCADSRVPIEIIFDQGFGDIFATRIAGNVANPEIIGSLEFGTSVLGAKVLYVLGHTSCGAVSAAARGEEVPGQISTLFYHLRPAVREARGEVDRAVRENVRIQAMLLSEASPVLARLIRNGRLRVAGGVYDLATGRVTPVDVAER